MNSIYLILDMQNDLVHADGPNGKLSLGERVRARRVVENTAAALEKARKAGIADDCCCAHSEQEHLNSIGSIARFCRVASSAKVDPT